MVYLFVDNIVPLSIKPRFEDIASKLGFILRGTFFYSFQKCFFSKSKGSTFAPKITFCSFFIQHQQTYYSQLIDYQTSAVLHCRQEYKQLQYENS
jgi:hypothetical protein